MPRSIVHKLHQFAVEYMFDLERIALNMDQVELYDPPPNVAKESDNRYVTYVAEFGESCWELDALSPDVLIALIRSKIEEYRDEALWVAALEREREDKNRLYEFARTWQ